MSLDKIITGLTEPIQKEQSKLDRDGIGESIMNLNRMGKPRVYDTHFVRYGGKKDKPKEEETKETKTSPGT